MKKMVNTLTLWRHNPMAPWPTDPAELLKLYEMMWAMMEHLPGGIKDTGLFTDGKSGYLIAEGDSTDALRASLMFSPFIEWYESEEIVPFEIGMKVTREALKAKAAAMAAMK